MGMIYNVANTIRAQIGVPAFMEVGAHLLQADETSLRFQIKCVNRRIRVVTVRLTPADTYTITHTDRKGFNVVTIEDVYNDALPAIVRGLIHHKG